MATLPSTMRAFIVSEYGDVDKLKLETDVQAPKPSPGFAIIKVRRGNFILVASNQLSPFGTTSGQGIRN
jgi:hypothetical protein